VHAQLLDPIPNHLRDQAAVARGPGRVKGLGPHFLDYSTGQLGGAILRAAKGSLAGVAEFHQALAPGDDSLSRMLHFLP
jgi:hypothetical protein